jgi:hypothetical protein
MAYPFSPPQHVASPQRVNPRLPQRIRLATEHNWRGGETWDEIKEKLFNRVRGL